MKRIVIPIFFAVLVLSILFTGSQNLFAQDPDTIDVTPNILGSLNRAVEGDTLPNGEPKNSVFRLSRGGWYLLDGSVSAPKAGSLRIVAAEGDGPMPMIIPAVGEAGYAVRVFNTGGDGEWKGLYISGIDNLGNQAQKNMFQINGEECRFIIDDCLLDYDAQAFIRMNSPNQKIYITNSIFRNAARRADPWDGIMIAARGGVQDTIFVHNCTFYVGSYRPMDSYGGVLKNVIFNHNTFYQFGGTEHQGNFSTNRSINLIFTNNLLIDIGCEGDQIPDDPVIAAADTFAKQILPIDSLKASELATEDQRNILIKNNVYGWTPEVKAWLDGIETLKPYEFQNLNSTLIMAANPNMVSENNIEEYPVFTDAPDPDTMVAYADYRFKSGYSNENNPAIWADKNGRSDLTQDPSTMGPAEDEYNFDYSTSSLAYTHAEGGLPAGDLNWWPDITGVEDLVVVPTRYKLAQNFPNPFNPSTTIKYQIAKQDQVELTIHNMLGQKILTLVDKSQTAGEYLVEWNGRNNAGQKVASGVYFYRLTSGDYVQTKKMLLMK